MGPKTTISRDEEVDYKTFCSHTNGQGEKWWQVSYDGSWGGLAVSEEKNGSARKKQGASSSPTAWQEWYLFSCRRAVFFLVLLIDYTVKNFNVVLGIDSFTDLEKDPSEIVRELSCSFKCEPLKKVDKTHFQWCDLFKKWPQNAHFIPE